jgi:hypothetical protein
MCFACISKEGKSKIKIYPANTAINSEVYQQTLEEILIPFIYETYSRRDIVYF